MLSVDPRDEDTVLRLCDMDLAARREALYGYLSEHGPALTVAVRRLLLKSGFSYNVDNAADDIVQDTATALLRTAQSQKLLEVGSLRSYVYGAAKNTARMFLRTGRRSIEETVPLEDFWEKTDRHLQERDLDPLESEEFDRALIDCVESLPEKQREYAYLMAQFDCEPLKPAEIARIKRVSPVSVRNRLHAARKGVADCLKRKGLDLPFRAKGQTQ